MFTAKFEDAKTWQALISAISALVDEANFEISPKGLTLRAMDPSRIAMVASQAFTVRKHQVAGEPHQPETIREPTWQRISVMCFQLD